MFFLVLRLLVGLFLLSCNVEYDDSRQFEKAFAQSTPLECFLIRSGVLLEYKCTERNIVIPDSILEIAPWAFYDKNIESVLLPHTLLRIGGSAFKNNLLVSVELPDSVVFVGEFRF